MDFLGVYHYLAASTIFLWCGTVSKLFGFFAFTEATGATHVCELI